MSDRPVTPTPRSRGMLLFRWFLAAVAVVALVAVLSPGQAAGDPQQDLRAVQRKVDGLTRDVSDLTERYNVAKIKLSAAKKRSSGLAKKVKRQRANVERLRKDVAARASSAYINGPADVASLVTARTPQDVLDMTTSLDLLSQHGDHQLAGFSEASKKLAAQQTTAARALTEQRQMTAKIGGTRDKILTALGAQKRLLSRLEEQMAQQRERAQERASRDSGTRAVQRPSGLPSVSGRVGQVIAFAEAQLGKPYQWGADGPDSYDCSGLTLMAWRQAGVSLPHSSQMQYSGGTKVPRSDLQPGDLVFFYQPISHVGLYVGGGKMIAAPSSGDVVKYADITSSYYQANYTGAVRPG